MYYNNDIRETFVIGFLNPILLLPRQEYDRQVLPFIFLHECNHIRHRDTLYKLFMLIMQSLMWFQPLMYLLKAVSFMDVEVACDEAVVEGKDKEARKAYGMAYMPTEKDGVLTLYVGMEDYSEYGGTKAKYVSTDDGATWRYCGLVLRQ